MGKREKIILHIFVFFIVLLCTIMWNSTSNHLNTAIKARLLLEQRVTVLEDYVKQLDARIDTNFTAINLVNESIIDLQRGDRP